MKLQGSTGNVIKRERRRELYVPPVEFKRMHVSKKFDSKISQ